MTAHGKYPDRRFLDLNERAQFEFGGISLAATWLGSNARQATAGSGDPGTICCVGAPTETTVRVG